MHSHLTTFMWQVLYYICYFHISISKISLRGDRTQTRRPRERGGLQFTEIKSGCIGFKRFFCVFVLFELVRCKSFIDIHIILLQSFWNISTNIFAICILIHTYKIRMLPICESKTNKNVLNLLIHKVFFSSFFPETEMNVPRPKKMFQPRITHHGLQYQVFFVLT